MQFINIYIIGYQPLLKPQNPVCLQNNPLALPFEEALESSGISLNCKNSDNTVFYLRREEVACFIDKLQVICSTANDKAGPRA